jgi:hypothetical protein
MVLSSNDAMLGIPLCDSGPEPASASLRAICSGRARLSMKASDAVSLLLSGRAECMIWANDALTGTRAAVIALLNVGAVAALATFGLGIWAFGWWAFAALPALAGFYLYWAQAQERTRLWLAAGLLILALAVAAGLSGQAHKSLWLASIAVACLLLQASHYLAYRTVRAAAMSNSIAFEGLERKGIIKVVAFTTPSPAGRGPG